MTNADVMLRLLLAAVLGGVIGLERESHGRAAGLRTHILVCLGAALIMMTSVDLFSVYQNSTRIDPFRIAAQVVSGIGFLGAGTIIRFKASVRGLTTAASLWVAAGIGLAVGSGFYVGALFATFLVLVSLFFLTRLEYKIIRKDWYKTLSVVSGSGVNQLKDIREILGEYNAEIRDFEIKKIDGDKVTLKLNLKLVHVGCMDEIISGILSIKGIEAAKWLE
ncbi:MAG: MgtC/SapB family protein [Candidatus Omnitrophota bacterium]